MNGDRYLDEYEKQVCSFLSVKPEIEEMINELNERISEKYGYNLEYTDIYIADPFSDIFFIT